MADTNYADIEAPEIVASRLVINSEKEYVTLEFLDKLDEESGTGRVVSKINIKNEDYFNFVLSFLEIGAKAQKEKGINLGIDISENK